MKDTIVRLLVAFWNRLLRILRCIFIQEETAQPSETVRIVVEIYPSPEVVLTKKILEDRKPLLPLLGVQIPAEINFVEDTNYSAVVMEDEIGIPTVTIRGTIALAQLDQFGALPNIRVWQDVKIEHFQSDCDYKTAQGTLKDVAQAIGAETLWRRGARGQHIVVGVCDGGVDHTIFPVTNGWFPRGAPAYGTVSSSTHGNMVANAVLGIAPDVELYDIGLLKGDPEAYLSDALNGFDWAIKEFKRTGKPHILTNSWGIYQKAWGPGYAVNSTHPFTRKVIEAIQTGIIVLFSSGNCGIDCPDDRCKGDVGPSKDIWGANGHKDVITVGAVNIHDQWVGYSSQGPAALWPEKPDLCGITHFKGYYSVDTGTSAATPICAGVAALIKSYYPVLSHYEIKLILIKSARDLGPIGWDPKFGHGVVCANIALEIASEISTHIKGSEGAAMLLWGLSCC